MKRYLLAGVLFLALAYQGYAQQRSPATMTTLPASTPQEFDLLDNTGKWVPFGSASGGVFLDTSRGVSPVAFGARCDGVTDDTTALQAWASATTANAHMVVPGVCVFKDRLTFPVVNSVTLEGSGRPSKLLYAGTSTTLDPIIQIGVRPSHGCQITGWKIQGLVFMSNTVMTAGDGLRINGGCLLVVEDLKVGSSLGEGNSNFYNAVRLEGGNTLHVHAFVFRGSNDALALSGDSDAGLYQIEASLLQGQMVNSKVGLHLCGGVGGGLFDSIDTINNGTNVLIDRTCVNKAYTQEMFGPHFMSDVTVGSPGIGFHVMDPGGQISTIIYRGWLASATNQCFVIDAGTPDNPSFPPQVNFIGAQIGNCHSPSTSNGTAIDNQNTYYKISVATTNFFTSLAAFPTIYNIAGAPAISITSIVPDANFNFSGLWGGLYQNSIGQLVISDPSTNNAASVIISATNNNAQGATLRLDGNGATTPRKWLKAQNGNFFMLSDAGNVIWQMADSGYQTLVVLTFATLPTCAAGQAGRLALISDANAPAYGTNVTTGGGTTRTLLLCNGTNWTAH